MKSDSRVASVTISFLNGGKWQYEVKLSTYEDGVRRAKGFRTNHPHEVITALLDNELVSADIAEQAPYSRDTVPFKP